MVVKVNRSRTPGHVCVRVFPSAAAGDARQASRGHSRHSRQHQDPIRRPCASSAATIRRRAAWAATAGTTVDLSPLDKIMEFGEHEVRAQAGVRVGTLARALAERGQELPLTPEMGHMTLGAMAVTTLPQASYEPGAAQMSSCVKELKLITPQGKQMTVTERNADLMRVLSSSFGLLGVVHEVVMRVRPLTPVRIDYQVLSLKEFSAQFAGIVKAPGAVRLHVSPFNDRITVERRTLDETASIGRAGIWQIKKSVMRNVLPAFGSTVGSVLAAPGVTGAVVSGMQRALRATLDRAARNVVLLFARVDPRLSDRGLEVALYLCLVGISAGRISEIARRVFRVLQFLLQAAWLPLQCRERREPAAPGQELALQRELRRPHVHARAFLDRRPRLGRFPDRLQRIRLRRGRRADVQSIAGAEARARRQGVRRARETVPRAARAHRSAQPALQQLLRASPGVSAARACTAGRRDTPVGGPPGKGRHREPRILCNASSS